MFYSLHKIHTCASPAAGLRLSACVCTVGTFQLCIFIESGVLDEGKAWALSFFFNSAVLLNNPTSTNVLFDSNKSS